MTPLGQTVSGRLVGRRISEARDMFETGTTAAASGMIVSSSSLDGMLRRILAGKLLVDPGIRFGDGSFYLPLLNEVEAILKASQSDRRTWLAERFDCDDFAYVLKGEMSVHAYETPGLKFGLCVGIVWGYFDWVQGYHAVNWFLDDQGVLRFVEPQTDQIYDLTHCQGEISLLLA